MAHSKRNTSSAVFTAYERSSLKGIWGSRSTRLSRESFLPFGSCRLCLQPARDPVSCADKGHLFCRECAIENLVAQADERKRWKREKERRAAEEEEDRRREELEAEERAVREFEMVQEGIRIRSGGGEVVGREAGKVVIEKEEQGKKGVKRKFELDEAELLRLASEDREKTKRKIAAEQVDEQKRTELPSFWVPSQTPNAASSLPSERASQHPICPADDTTPHEFSLKTLVAVHFHEDASSSTQEDPKRICPSCNKILSNATKAVLARPCGHVLCRPCSAQFQTPHIGSAHDSDQDGKKGGAVEGEVRCYVCQTDITPRQASSVAKEAEGAKEKKDKKGKKHKEEARGLIELATDGTGFAGGGTNMVRKEGVAFQC